MWRRFSFSAESRPNLRIEAAQRTACVPLVYDVPSVEKKDAEAYLLQHNSFVRSENMKIRGQDDFSIWPLIIYSSEYFTQ